MPTARDSGKQSMKMKFTLVLIAAAIATPAWNNMWAAEGFSGEKTTWHGFDRYDFIMDENTLAIKPTKAGADEKNGVKDPAPGQRRCIVVVPKKPLEGGP